MLVIVEPVSLVAVTYMLFVSPEPITVLLASTRILFGTIEIDTEDEPLPPLVIVPEGVIVISLAPLYVNLRINCLLLFAARVGIDQVPEVYVVPVGITLEVTVQPVGIDTAMSILVMADPVGLLAVK